MSIQFPKDLSMGFSFTYNGYECLVNPNHFDSFTLHINGWFMLSAFSSQALIDLFNNPNDELYDTLLKDINAYSSLPFLQYVIKVCNVFICDHKIQLQANEKSDHVILSLLNKDNEVIRFHTIQLNKIKSLRGYLYSWLVEFLVIQ